MSVPIRQHRFNVKHQRNRPIALCCFASQPATILTLRYSFLLKEAKGSQLSFPVPGVFAIHTLCAAFFFWQLTKVIGEQRVYKHAHNHNSFFPTAAPLTSCAGRCGAPRHLPKSLTTFRRHHCSRLVKGLRARVRWLPTLRPRRAQLAMPDAEVIGRH